jgi:phenylacetate-CoA ligase
MKASTAIYSRLLCIVGRFYHRGMLRTSPEQRRFHMQLDRATLRQHQLERLNALLAAIVPHNRFYSEKLGHIDLPLQSLDDLRSLPYTFKDELLTVSGSGDFAANCSFPLERYVRYHQTSGTRGRPMAVLDTAEDWQWWIDCWQYVLDAAEIGAEDRVLLAFSFGPFIGFWSAHDAAVARGTMVVPSGGLSTLSRVEMIRNCRATALFCTPSYALRLAEVALENRIDPASLEVRRIVVAGEPGGSVPSLRKRIENAWNARLIDHAGASEVGPWGYSDPGDRGLHIIETEFIAEFLSVATGEAAQEGELSELVLTPLGRLGSPVVRYRTGDLVRPTFNHDGTTRFVLLEGGVLGRADDMLIVRGVNIFPSSLEQILRSFPEVVEFRTTCRKQGAMDVLSIEVEDRLDRPERIAREMNLRLGLKVEIRCVPLGSLPRFDGKGRRFVDLRQAAPS